MRAAGKRLRMQPFITPTKGPWWPKSVVMVMTPGGTRLALNRGPRGRAAAGTRSARSAQVRQRSV